jgi:hypothetical protein
VFTNHGFDFAGFRPVPAIANDDEQISAFSNVHNAFAAASGSHACVCVRLRMTAGLAKDVIDLMEKKLSLLTEENTMLAAKVSQLEVENGQLRAQLKNPKARPPESGRHRCR